MSAFSPDARAQRGRQFEAAVFRHLRAVARELPADLWFHRTDDGLEIDFLLQTDKEIVGIEVKSSTRVRAEEIRRLRLTGSALGASRMLLVHGGTVSEPGMEVPLIALPEFLLDPVAVVRGEQRQP